MKCSEIIGYADQANARKRSLCQDSVQYVVLGGQTKGGNNPLTPFIKGEDATNPLSMIALKAGHLKLKQPTIKVRYFDGINEEFWLEVCRLARAGGSIGIYNDDVEIPAFTSVGVELEDARNYVHYGCCNANVPGKEGSLMERWHSLPKYLELVMNNGVDPLTGNEEFGIRNAERGINRKDIADFKSLDDLLEAFRLQLRHVLEAERANAPFIRPEDYSRYSFTLESVFLDDCIENGREWRLGGTKYWHKSQHGCGIATIADSLSAIQKVVFEDKELTLTELRDILNADFEGHEPLRQKLLNRCPKYGNDDDYVDSIAVRVGNIFCDEVLRCNEVRHSVTFWPEIYTYHHNKGFGASLGATPDGRKKGENISENQSPSYGMDIKGVTACLNSIAKLPTHRTPGGGTNLKIHPSAVAGEDGLKALSNLLKTYFNRGGQHLQLNILDRKTLEEAQQNPAQYKTLSVRVVGYSAYFVTLSKKVQNDIIERMEHTL
ncbi:MAG: pyruvate formate lyase family protein [Candidatus Poribacteria bacterium]